MNRYDEILAIYNGLRKKFENGGIYKSKELIEGGSQKKWGEPC
jgi:hypothetical protein